MELVQQSDGVLTTTSEIIAEGVELQHKNVLDAIRKNQADFEEFGRVAFETRPFETAGGPQKRTVAILNREQAMFAMTLFRNNPVVVEFKKNLIKAFIELENQVKQATTNVAELTRLEIIKIAMNAETERLELEAKNKVLTPKAEVYDEFLDATGNYGVGTVAKMLGKSRTWLFNELRNTGIFIPEGSMRNTPYQPFMEHFEVKPFYRHTYSGEVVVNYTTYVKPSGIDFIRRKLNLPLRNNGAMEVF